ncbi:hypothetical protein DPMN_129821 [Dreissena polymorpha]|uniref:Uncharacterized protein n=1 Tax=Dreissena polymorpha TaxID=45954 RepID=A0A9D4H3Y7_DREPO|nr:hypothetical protein DPMN_129821 [Dreissena polymorpha]
MTVLVSGDSSGWGLGAGSYASAGRGGSGSLGGGALVRGRRALRSVNWNEMQPSSTDRRT